MSVRGLVCGRVSGVGDGLSESASVCGGPTRSLCIHDRISFPLRKVLKLLWISPSCIVLHLIAFVSINIQRRVESWRKTSFDQMRSSV